MGEFAELTFRGRTIRLPVVEGTEGDIGLDVSSLRSELGAPVDIAQPGARLTLG